MNDRTQLLISLEERHANNILAGTKKVELRRRTMHISPGSIVWFYVKKPIAAIVGYAEVGPCESATPTSIWKKLGPVSGLERKEFMTYFEGLETAFAINLLKPQKLDKAISLTEARKSAANFTPPQFYNRLHPNSALHNLLSKKLTSNTQNKKHKAPKQDSLI